MTLVDQEQQQDSASKQGVANSTDVDDRLLTPSEVAARLCVRIGWVYRHADDLGVLRMGKYLRFSWYRVLQCISSNEEGLTTEKQLDLVRSLVPKQSEEEK